MGGTDASVPGMDSAVGTDSAMGTDSAIGTDAAAGGFVISWVSGTVDADCQPAVPTDPWNIDFTIRYDNTGDTVPHTATITSATWGAYNMAITPTGSGLVAAGTMMDVGHVKMSLMPSPMSDCTPCGTQTVIDLTFDVDGVPVQLTSPMVTANCVF